MSWEPDPNEIPRTVLGPSRPREPQYLSGHRYAAAITWLLGLDMVLAAAAIYSTAMLIQLLWEIQDSHGAYFPDEVFRNIVRHGVIVVSQSAARLATGVTFLIWIHRSHRNLQTLGNRKLKYSPGWAVACWFVPILNAVCPYQVMVEIWKGSDPRNVNDADPRRGKGSILVGCWWASHIIMGLAALVAAWNISGKKDIDTLVLTGLLWILYGILTVPAAALAIMVVRRVNRNQERRKAILQSRAEAGPALVPNGTKMPNWLDTL
jgi:hypothetical protein